MNNSKMRLKQYKLIKCRHLNLPNEAYSKVSKYNTDRYVRGWNKNPICRLKFIENPDCHNCNY